MPQATTSDPDLRLLVDGRIIRPSGRDGPTYRFDVPDCVFEARIVSRSVVPAVEDPALADHRRLGVSLVSLTFRSPDLDVLVQADDPALKDGYHVAEAGHRWTDGRAVIPSALLQCFPDGFTLELVIDETQLPYPLG